MHIGSGTIPPPRLVRQNYHHNTMKVAHFCHDHLMRIHPSLVATVAALGLLTAACSSSSPSASTADATTTVATDAETTTTTIDPATQSDAYVEPGPYPVGVTTVTIANDIKVEIWYPAVAGSAGTETYDIRDFVAPAIKAILTADIPATYSYPATRDAAVADGKFPVVLNSHGYSGVRVGSAFLTSHLASWGMIVVSPDHPTRDLYHAVAGLKPDVPTDPADDLLGGLDYVTAQNTTATSPFAGHVDLDRVGALGHSAGGGTILKASLDPRIDGYVSMASGILTGASAPAETTLPDKPSFFMSGAIDQVVPQGTTRDAFLKVPTPSLFWQIDGVGHNGFDDFCTFGEGKGIIGIAEASGLGAFLDAQPQFRKLGADGCVPPAVPVATTFPIIQHAVSAWFLNLFGVDSAPKGLGAAVADSFAAKVTIEQR